MMNLNSTKQNKKRSSLNSGLDVLESIASQHRPLTLTEIATCVDMSKSSVHQLLATLEKRGFTKRSADQRYSIGIKAWEIGCVAAPIELARVAAPHMANLVRETNDGVSLGILDGAEMVCIHLIESPRAVRVHSSIGDRTPAHCVSSGLAVLSTMDNETVSKLLPDKLQRSTDDTIIERGTLIKELIRVRGRGYAVSRGAWRVDVAGVSVPICGLDGRAVAALCIAAPRFRVHKEWIDTVVPNIKSAVQSIERDLGVSAGDANARMRAATSQAG